MDAGSEKRGLEVGGEVPSLGFLILKGKALAGVQIFDSARPSGKSPWSFLPASESTTMAALAAATPLRLLHVADRMAQGIRTSMNTVYVVSRVGNQAGRYFSDHLGREIELEPDLLHPFLDAAHMRRYDVLPSDRAVIVPYSPNSAGDSALIEARRLARDYPKTWAYLKQCEAALRGREDGKMDKDGWYGFVYPKNLDVMQTSKIMVPDIVEAPTFSLDAKGGLSFVSGYAITPKVEYAKDTHYLLGLLNSTALGGFLKAVSTPLRGGWYRPFPQFMEQLPIKLPETTEEKGQAARITESVRAIMAAKTKLRATNLSDRDRQSLESEVEAHEARINEAVYLLYGVESASA